MGNRVSGRISQLFLKMPLSQETCLLILSPVKKKAEEPACNLHLIASSRQFCIVPLEYQDVWDGDRGIFRTP